MRKATAAPSDASRIEPKNSRTNKLTRVLIVDDHPIVIAGCRSVLAVDKKIVIAEASDAESALASFTSQSPDVCLIDINLPGVSGFELARRIFRQNAAVRFIMFGISDDPILAARAIAVGAKGYLCKSGDTNDLIVAIHSVRDGGVFLPPSIAQSLAFARPTPAANLLARLTAREIEILRLICIGKSRSEIASLLKVSYKTVANSSSAMRQKLGVHSVPELVRVAIESRLT